MNDKKRENLRYIYKVSRLEPTFNIKILLIVLIVYAFTSFLLSNDMNPMQASFISLTKSLVKAKTITVDNFISNNTDLSFYKGHFYSGLSPALSFFIVPHYLIFKQFTDKLMILLYLFSITSTLPCVAFSLVFLYLLLRDMGSSEKESRSLTFLCAFGTLFLCYGTSLDARVMASSAIVIVFYLIHHNKSIINEKSGFLSVMIGMLLGLISSFNYASLLLIPIFSLYFVYNVLKPKNTSIFKKCLRIGLFLIGLSVPLCLLAGYHYLAFGNYFSTPYSFRFTEWTKSYHSEGICGFTYPKIRTLIQLLFLPYRGAFFYMPVFLFSFMSLPSAFKKNTELILSAVCMFMFILYNAGLKWWNGEWCFGPRLLTEAIPFAIILAASIIRKYKRLYYFIFIYSIIVNFSGTNFRWEQNMNNPFSAIIRYTVSFAINGLVRPSFYKSLFSNFLLTSFINFSTISIVLFLISYVLYDFRIFPLLESLAKDIKKISLVYIIKIFSLAILFSLPHIFFDKIHYADYFTRSLVNIFLVLLVFLVFKNILFGKIIEID
jgi:hypothetical protein